MGKRDLLSDRFVVRVLTVTCLPRYPYRRKNIAYPAKGSENRDFLLRPASRVAVT